jgi:beta-xylosidase
MAALVILLVGCSPSSGSRAERGRVAPHGATPSTLAVPRALDPAPNPVLDHDFPDPDVVAGPREYVVFATFNGPTHVQRTVTRDFRSMGPITDALPTLPPWVAPVSSQVWAPDVAAVGAGFVMAFSARQAGDGRHCIGIARSAGLDTAFTADAAPLLCQPTTGGAIDPDIFMARGQAWLLWKNDGNAIGVASHIWSQPIDLSSMRLTGTPQALLGVDQRWEVPTVEGPDLVAVGDQLYLFYSGGSYLDSSYGVGYARCTTPSGPCAKPAVAPVLSTVMPVAGPGGEFVFRDRSGSWWVAYHAWTAPDIGYTRGGQRALRLDRLVFTDGIPAVLGPTNGGRRAPQAPP